MTDRNTAELIIILDRSGSMQSIARDMEGGFETFIRERKSDPVAVRVSLYQFDDHYEKVYESVPVGMVHHLQLDPRGSTALLDAVGRTINSVGARFAAMPEERRPGSVVVMIITDGQENASHEYTAAAVRSMIRHQEEKYNWKFLYLGADANAFGEAHSIGISPPRAARYSHNALGSRGLYTASSRGLRDYYVAQSNSIGGATFNADLNIGAAPGVEVSPDAVLKGGADPVKISSTTGK